MSDRKGDKPSTAFTDEYWNAVWKATANPMAIGNADTDANGKGQGQNGHGVLTRQITGVAAGTDLTDAVNVAQLKAAVAQFSGGGSGTGGSGVHDYSVKSVKPDTDTNYNNKGATGDNALAAGVSASATGAHSVAVGNGAQALKPDSIALGTNAKADGIGATAIGQYNTALGQNSLAFGGGYNKDQKGNTASGVASVAFGEGTQAIAEGTLAFGENTQAGSTEKDKTGNPLGQNSVAFGNGTKATGGRSLAFGERTLASANDATAFGNESVASNTGATAFGNKNQATGQYATAWGGGDKMVDGTKIGTVASGTYATAFGEGTAASGESATAFGSDSVASGKDSLAFGTGSTASGDNSMAGLGGTASTANSIALGKDTKANNADGTVSVAIGENAEASGARSLAIGFGVKGKVTEGGVEKDDTNLTQTTASGESAVSIGTDTKAAGQHSIAFGSHTEATKDSSLAIGYDTHATEASAVAIGSGTKVNRGYGVAIGLSALAGIDESDPASAGASTYDGAQTVALGYYARATATNAAALGAAASANVNGAVALGYQSATTREAGNKENGTVKDAYLKPAAVDKASTWTSTAGAVSIGNANRSQTRQLTNLAAGSDDTDAVNVAQLKQVKNALDDAHLDFAGDKGNSSVKLNKKVTVTGGETNPDNLVSNEKNIGVVASQAGDDSKLELKLAKDLKGLNSVTAGNTTMETNGITIKNANNDTNKDIVIKDGNIQFGGNQVTNMGSGINSTTNTYDVDTNGANIGDVKHIADARKTTVKSSDGTVTVVDKNANDPNATSHDYDLSVDYSKAAGAVDLKYTGDNNTSGQNKLSEAVAFNGTDNQIVTTAANGSVTFKLADDLKTQTVTVTGKDGKDGQIGITGKNGADGSVTTIIKTIGKNGTDGTNGTPGVNGTDGITRIVYQDGKDGEAGTTTHTVATLDDGLKFGANAAVENGTNPVGNKLNSTIDIVGTKAKDGHTYSADNLTTTVAQDENGKTTITVLMDNAISADSVKVGKDGKDGVSITGPNGKDGVNGIDGKVGISGKDGKDAVSIAGKDGVGHIGLTGPKGEDGQDGASIDISTALKQATLDSQKNHPKGSFTNAERITYTDSLGSVHDVATMDDGMKYGGDVNKTDNAPVSVKLNNQVNIKGETGEGKSLTTGNIGVEAEKDGDNAKLTIKLADKLTGLTSVTTGNTTMETSGITIKNANNDTNKDIVIKDGNIKFGGNQVTNMGSGLGNTYTDASDNNGANIGDVKHIADARKTTVKSSDGTVTVVDKNANDPNATSHDYDLSVDYSKAAGAVDLKYTGDNNTRGQNKLSEAVAFNGTANQIITTAANGSVTFKLADDLKTQTVTVTGKDGKDGRIGLTGKDGKDGTVTTIIRTIGKNGTDGTNGTPGVNGKDGITRIVYNDGKDGKDYTVATLDDGMKYAGNFGQGAAVKLNKTVTIRGELAKNAKETDFVDNNIAVVANQNNEDGELLIKLNKNLTGLNSSTYTSSFTGADGNPGTSTTRVDGTGLTITNGPSITNTGIDAGSKQIKNTASGRDGNMYDTKVAGHENWNNAANIGDVTNIAKDAADAVKAQSGKNITVDSNNKVNLNDHITMGDANNKAQQVDINGNAATITAGDGANKVTIDGSKGQVQVGGDDGIKIGNHEANDKNLTVYDKDGKATTQTDKAGKYITNLDNKTWNSNGSYVSGRGATEDQLHQVETNTNQKFDQVNNRIDAVDKHHTEVTVNGGTAAGTNGAYSGGNLQLNEKQGTDGQKIYDLKLNDNLNIGGAGKDGKDGTNGHIGINGADGKSGVGIDGKDGISIKGADGKAGVTITGKDGANGTEGHIGLTGAAGKDGKNAAADIQVISGQVGVDGTDGNGGKDGMDRISYTDHNNKPHEVATTDDGMKFAGDSGEALQQKLNSTTNIKGGATGELSEGNIGVVSDGKDTLTVKLAKDIKGLDSIETTTVNATTVNSSSFNIAGDDSHDAITIKQGDVNMGGNTISGVAPGKVSQDSTEAVNGSQLWQRDQAINGLSGSVNKLGNRINRVGAGAAALAALHPLDFDPDDKWDFAAGYGNYRGANAAAVGAYYRPNEDTMFSVGGSFGGGENMVNAGVSIKLGQGNHVSTSRVAMAKEIKDLRQNVANLNAIVNRQSALIDKLTGTNAGMIKDKGNDLFPDVPANHWAYEYVTKLKHAGILTGYPDGNFDGDRMMTRYEFAAIVYRAIMAGAASNPALNQDGTLDKLANEFSSEMKYIRIDTIAKDKNGKPTIERVRVISDAK
ncbi:YadA-like family protein [Megasphaera sp.]|uniref:YadA-like family protein n=1 Tax=Megasphaera sp. TaxID=2023260 RepID=UPI00257AD80A|nr:YadA-like family protein [Megasphaera sp.]